MSIDDNIKQIMVGADPSTQIRVQMKPKPYLARCWHLFAIILVPSIAVQHGDIETVFVEAHRQHSKWVDRGKILHPQHRSLNTIPSMTEKGPPPLAHIQWLTGLRIRVSLRIRMVPMLNSFPSIQLHRDALNLLSFDVYQYSRSLSVRIVLFATLSESFVLWYTWP